MHITFRQLLLFLALAETGSVSAAARRTHVTQPTASMQLREVTDSIGLTLYEVASRRVVLTEAGEELARTARAIADQWDEFEQRVATALPSTVGGRSTYIRPDSISHPSSTANDLRRIRALPPTDLWQYQERSSAWNKRLVRAHKVQQTAYPS